MGRPARRRAGARRNVAPCPTQRWRRTRLKGVTVTVVKATKTCFAATAEVFGVMLPMEEVSVTPPREGLRISQVLVDPGATVTAGQALIRLTQPEGGEITLVAPVAGTVSNVSATVGTMASARADPLFRIIARGEFEMVGDVPGKDMPGLATGQVATIRVVGAPSVQGRVRSVSSTIDPITQVGQVRIQIITPRPRLLVNASGRATIKTGESCNVAVPLTAILYGSGGAVIQVVRRQRVETKQVEVGLMSVRPDRGQGGIERRRHRRRARRRLAARGRCRCAPSWPTERATK